MGTAQVNVTLDRDDKRRRVWEVTGAGFQPLLPWPPSMYHTLEALGVGTFTPLFLTTLRVTRNKTIADRELKSLENKG